MVNCYISIIYSIRLTPFLLFGLSNIEMAVSLQTSANFCFKNSPCWNILFHPKEVTEPAQALNVNALNYVYAVKEVEQLLIGLDTEIIADIYRRI